MEGDCGIVARAGSANVTRNELGFVPCVAAVADLRPANVAVHAIRIEQGDHEAAAFRRPELARRWRRVQQRRVTFCCWVWLLYRWGIGAEAV